MKKKRFPTFNNVTSGVIDTNTQGTKKLNMNEFKKIVSNKCEIARRIKDIYDKEYIINKNIEWVLVSAEQDYVFVPFGYIQADQKINSIKKINKLHSIAKSNINDLQKIWPGDKWTCWILADDSDMKSFGLFFNKK